MKKISIGFLSLMAITCVTAQQTTTQDKMQTTSPVNSTTATSQANAAMATDPMNTRNGINQYDYSVQQYYDKMESDRLGTYKLTDQQRAQYQNINEDYNRNIGSLKDNSGLSNDQIRLKMYSYQNERRQKYMQLLNEEDQRNYQSYMNDWNYNYNNIDNLRTDVGLSDDQYKRMNELNNTYSMKEASIINNQDLKDEERNNQLMALSKEKSGTYKAILSADQVLKMEHKNNGTLKIKTQTGDDTKKMKTKPDGTEKMKTKSAGKTIKTKTKAPAMK